MLQSTVNEGMQGETRGLSTRNGKFVPGLEAQAGVSARRDERAMPERIVSEEQQRDGPGMGFPEGPGAFELRLCRASLTYRCGYARSVLRGSLRIRSGKPGTNLPFSVLSFYFFGFGPEVVAHEFGERRRDLAHHLHLSAEDDRMVSDPHDRALPLRVPPVEVKAHGVGLRRVGARELRVAAFQEHRGKHFVVGHGHRHLVVERLAGVG